MTHGMKLPKSMTIRATVSALQKINMALPVFPDATDEDRFSDNEILNILEFMVPPAWRTAFDKKGYIPATCDRKRFIEECEILDIEERMEHDAFFKLVAEHMAPRLETPIDAFYKLMHDREDESSTVIVAGLAQTSSAAMAIQYPPEAATLPIETTTVFPDSFSACTSRLIFSEANTSPPGLLIRSTTASTLLSSATERNS